ncbi:MAG: hypothetical protein ABI895_19655 [Deltaproteobacteria bacterium]
MQGFLTICAVMGALGLAACGSPSELEGEFPSLDKTGYVVAGGSGMMQVVVPGGQGGSAGAVASSGGSSGSPANGGGAQTGAGSSTGTTGGSSGSSGCPSDITTLFARPISQGGCTSGGGCHEPTSPIKPDLVSPNVAGRLLNVPSSCSKTSSGMSVQPRPYIGKDDSFLEEKIAGSPDSSCGISMPFFAPDALSAADEQCIIQWIDQVAGG